MRIPMTCTIISNVKELDIAYKNECRLPYPEIKTRLRSKIWQLYRREYDRLWLNCEYGVPLWCAEIIIALKMYNDIGLYIAMPYEEQATDWNEEHRERFFNVHARADKVIMISNYYTTDCCDLADIHMIDDSDMILIVGDDTMELFGSKYAREKNVSTEYLIL